MLRLSGNKSGARDSYFRLVREFPLRPLRHERDLAAANAVALRLLTERGEEMDAGERDYFDAITLLIREAEREMLKNMTAGVTPLKLLKHLMQERAMSVGDLGKIIGSQPAASLLLRGKRSISKPQMRALADHFHLSPAAFLD